MQHPVALLYLRLEYDHLVSLVRFIYLGQCEVEQKDIETFLLIAKQLKIEGLTDEDETIEGGNYGEKPKLDEDFPDFQNHIEEYMADESRLQAAIVNNVEIEYKITDSKESLNFEPMINESEELKSIYMCPMCNQKFEELVILKTHMEDIHQEKNVDKHITEEIDLLETKTIPKRQIVRRKIC
jgi:hypothetical protein